MTFGLWIMLLVIWTAGGIWDSVLAEAGNVADPDVNTIVAGAEVLHVDDIETGGLNAIIAIPKAGADVIVKAFQLASFDYDYLQGPLQIIRYVLLTYLGAMILITLKDFGPAMIGALRSLLPF